MQAKVAAHDLCVCVVQGTRQERGVCPFCGEAVYSDQDRVSDRGVYYHALCNQAANEKALREQESDNMRKLREMAFDRPMPGHTHTHTHTHNTHTHTHTHM
jgi:hypothetical protein